jgi:hypothetical protein
MSCPSSSDSQPRLGALLTHLLVQGAKAEIDQGAEKRLPECRDRPEQGHGTGTVTGCGRLSSISDEPQVGLFPCFAMLPMEHAAMCHRTRSALIAAAALVIAMPSAQAASFQLRQELVVEAIGEGASGRVSSFQQVVRLRMLSTALPKDSI